MDTPINGGDACVGVPVNDGDEEEFIPMGVAAPLVETDIVEEQYANPCGAWADIGRFRDVWWALAWILCSGVFIGYGSYRYVSDNPYQVSTGTASLATPCNNPPCQAKLKTDGTCQIVGRLSYAAVCDSTYLYLTSVRNTDQATYNERDVCGSFGRIKHARNVVKYKLSEQGGVYPPVVGTSISKISCHAGHEFLGTDVKAGRVIELGGLSIVTAFAVSIVLLLAMKYFPVAVIISSNVLGIGCFAALSIFLLMEKLWGSGLLLLFCTFVHLVVFVLCWKKIPFAAVCLKLSSTVITTYWGTIVVGIGMLLLSIALFVPLLGVANPTTDSAILMLVVIFVFYWGSEVLKNIVHVTTSGVTADWFFSLGWPGTPASYLIAKASDYSPTPAALRRASTWSLGSICFGSLIVAIIRTIRTLLRAALRNRSVISCLIMCLLGYIEALMRYFNDYAYVQVAMFGKPYITASKDTWKLVKSGVAWDALINDSLLDYVFVMFTLEGSLIVFVVCYGVSQSLLAALVSLLLAAILISVMMRLVYSGVLTVFIGFWQVRSVGAVWTPVPVGGTDAVSKEVFEGMDQKYTTN